MQAHAHPATEPQSLLDLWNIVAPFVPVGQRKVMAATMRAAAYATEPVYDEPIARLAGIILAMPTTGQTDGMGDDAIVHLHYFGPGQCDWWITEKDVGDGAGDYSQHQAFGLARMHEPELGYISIEELVHTVPANPLSIINLDFHFAPRPLRDVWAELGKVR